MTRPINFSTQLPSSEVGLQRELVKLANKNLVKEVCGGLSGHILSGRALWSGGVDWGDVILTQQGVKKGLNAFRTLLEKGTIKPTERYIQLYGWQKATTTQAETIIPDEALSFIHSLIHENGWSSLFRAGGDYYVELCGEVHVDIATASPEAIAAALEALDLDHSAKMAIAELTDVA
ncbi:hypothetical protein P7C70_g2705, partial [Phenoliferia sp. Uapishka_3]